MHNPISLYSNSTTKAPSHIDSHHYQEWLDSGVNETITSLNVDSIHDSSQLDKILNRNNKSRHKHSDNLVPAWCVRGINPQGWEQILEGVQVKPDNPTIRNGKPQKYLTASGYDTAPLFLDTGIPAYWSQVIEDKPIQTFIFEGAKKAGAALSLGYAAISIPGVSTCRKKGRLHKSLQLFCGYGRTFYLGFDNDVMTKKPVQDALLNLSRDLSATGSKVMILQFPPGEAKGADDFIVANGPDAFHDLIKNAKTVEEWREEIKDFWLIEQERIKETNKSKLARYMHILKLGWGDGLRFNRLKNQIEKDGEIFDLEQVRLRIALEFDMDVPVYDAISIIDLLAKQQSYHPVQEYLEDIARQHPNPDLSILDNLATRYLGSSEELHNIYMRKTLIAAVARIYEPGCQHDAATIFVGKQYAGKSSFWRKLFSREFFTDQLGEATKSEDELAKVHQFWGLEWSEFETVYRKKDVASLKKFMSASVDAFRLPYARTTKEYPRQSILVGTSNETEILNDPTGSRRFWIIPINQESIPLDLLEEERDLLWAAAYFAYQSGERWELDKEDRVKQADLNKDFESEDPWHQKILSYIQDKCCVGLEDIFHHLAIEPSRQDMGLTKRVSAILHKLNWNKIRKYLNGVWVRVWEKTKVTFLGGSRGSSQEEVVQDTSTYVEHDGGDKVADFRDTGDLAQDSVAHYTVSKKSDSLVDRVDMQPEQEFPKNNSQLDPRDPPPKPTFIFDEKTDNAVSNPSPTPTEILCPRTGLPLPPAFEEKFESVLGISTAVVNFVKVRKDNRIAFTVDLTFANGKTSRKHGSTGLGKPEVIKVIEKEINARTLEAIKHPSRRYSVFQIIGTMLEPEGIWVGGCTCTETPEHPINSFYVFKTPSGDRIQVAGDNEFKLDMGT